MKLIIIDDEMELGVVREGKAPCVFRAASATGEPGDFGGGGGAGGCGPEASHHRQVHTHNQYHYLNMHPVIFFCPVKSRRQRCGYEI